MTYSMALCYPISASASPILSSHLELWPSHVPNWVCTSFLATNLLALICVQVVVDASVVQQTLSQARYANRYSRPHDSMFFRMYCIDIKLAASAQSPN